MIDANDLIQKGSKILKNNIITHQIDSELILSNILQTKREDLTLSSKIKLSQNQIEKFKEDVIRRVKRESLHIYLISVNSGKTVFQIKIR